MRSLQEFKISVPEAHWAKDQAGKRHFYYEVRSTRIKQISPSDALTDSAVRRYADFKLLDKKLREKYDELDIPELPLIKYRAGFGEDPSDPEVISQCHDLQQYLRSLQYIELVADSFDFQNFLPRMCRIRLRVRNRGIHLTAEEILSRTKAFSVQLNLNPTLRLLRITFMVRNVISERFVRNNVSLDDIVDFNYSSKFTTKKDAHNVCVLNLKNGTMRYFRFASTVEADLFMDFLKSTLVAKTLDLLEIADTPEEPASEHPEEKASPSSRPAFVREPRSRILSWEKYVSPSSKKMRAAATPTGAVAPVGAIVGEASEFCGAKPPTSFVLEHFSNLSVFVSTWNLARENIEGFASQLLPPKSSTTGERDFDVFALGFQECKSFEGSRFNIEARVADHILEELGDRYFLVGRKSLWELSLMVFCHVSLKESVSSVESKSFATGFLGLAGNKGAVAMSFRIFHTSFCFLTSHLAPHQHALQERNRMYREILAGVRLGDSSVDINLQFDYMFWFGDLNYRLDMQSHAVAACARRKLWPSLLRTDQLRVEMLAQRTFCGFHEAEIAFPPTYKFVLHKRPGKKGEKKEDSEKADSDEDESVISGKGSRGVMDSGSEKDLISRGIMDSGSEKDLIASTIMDEKEADDLLNTITDHIRNSVATKGPIDSKWDPSEMRKEETPTMFSGPVKAFSEELDYPSETPTRKRSLDESPTKTPRKRSLEEIPSRKTSLEVQTYEVESDVEHEPLTPVRKALTKSGNRESRSSAIVLMSPPGGVKIGDKKMDAVPELEEVRLSCDEDDDIESHPETLDESSEILEDEDEKCSEEKTLVEDLTSEIPKEKRIRSHFTAGSDMERSASPDKVPLGEIARTDASFHDTLRKMPHILPKVDSSKFVTSRGRTMSMETRSYNLKRVPSYTDRILWTSNLSDENGGHEIPCIDFYTALVEPAQSDHLSVVAGFQLKVLRWIPAEAFATQIQIFPRELSVSLSPEVLENVSSLSMMIHGQWLVDRSESPLRKKEDLLAPQVDSSEVVLNWPESYAPSLLLRVGDERFLTQARFFVSIRAESGAVIGQCEVRLGFGTTKKYWGFRTRCFSKGVGVGYLSGSLQLVNKGS